MSGRHRVCVWEKVCLICNSNRTPSCAFPKAGPPCVLLVCFSQFHLPGKNSKGFCIKCPNHDSFRYKGAVVPVVMSGILTASQRVNPETPRRKVVLAAGIRNLILSVSTSGSWPLGDSQNFFPFAVTMPSMKSRNGLRDRLLFVMGSNSRHQECL